MSDENKDFQGDYGSLKASTARRFGASELALGDRFVELTHGDGLLRLGYSSLGDYGREKLNLRPQHAYELRALARALWATPLLRTAVHEGRVCIDHARLVVTEASKGDEASWVARSIGASIAELRAALGPGAPRADRSWALFLADSTPEDAVVVGAAMEVAAIVSDRGPATPRHERMAAIAMETLAGGCIPPGGLAAAPEDEARSGPPLPLMEAIEVGARGIHKLLGMEPVPDGAQDRRPVVPTAPVSIPVPAELRLRFEELTEELRRWDHLTELAPLPAGPPRDPAIIDAELLSLARVRAGWDEMLGRLCRMAKELRLWKAAGFESWEAYCEQELGMSEKNARNRIALERRLERLPELREALRTEQLGYEKVRRLSFVVTPDTTADWIEKARGTTVAQLDRLLDQEANRKISGTGQVQVTLPEETQGLLQDAIMEVRELHGQWLPTGKCLAIMSKHFLDVWLGDALRRLAAMGAIRRRDGGLCQAPGCTRPGTQVHHKQPQSQGGGDEPSNLICLCSAHHLHGIHLGFIQVEGSAPDGLTWWFGGDQVKGLHATGATNLDELYALLKGLAAIQRSTGARTRSR